MKKIILSALTLSIALALPSCRGIEDVWDGNFQQRMTQYLNDCDAILKGAANGWHMIYYAGDAPGNMMGAMNYHLVFSGTDQVTVTADFDTENYPAGTPLTSLYTLKSDAGATLSFDTYSEILHYFTEYKGSSATYRGDFEFVIQEVTADRIVMIGKRFGRMIVMVPWTQGDPQTYLAALNDFINTVAYPNYTYTADGEEYAASFDIDARRLAIALPEGTFYFSLLFDLNGFYLSQIGWSGVIVNMPEPYGYFEWNEATETFSQQADGQLYVFERTIPEGYIPYDDYPGTYTLTYRTAAGETFLTAEVTLSEGIRNKTFILSPNLTGYELTLNYKWSDGGRVELLSQFLEEQTVSGTALHLWSAAYYSAQDYLNINTSYGLDSYTISYSPLTFSMVDNGLWSGYIVNGVILYYMDITDTSYIGIASGTIRFLDMTFEKQSDHEEVILYLDISASGEHCNVGMQRGRER